jgi:hypothetical protein
MVISHFILVYRGKLKCKFVHVINTLNKMHLRHNGVWRYSSTILDLDTRRRFVVSQPYAPSRFIPREIVPGTHWIGGWLGPGAGLEAVEKRNILPSRESNRDRLARSPSLYRLLSI